MPRQLRLRAPITRIALTFLFILTISVPLYSIAETIIGTVRDPSGAVVAQARVEISGGDLSQPLVLASDDAGNFGSPDLKRGTYVVRITKDGFETQTKTVELHGSVVIDIALAIAKPKITVGVAGKSGYANSDPIYQELRKVGLGESFRLKDFTLKWDVGTFQFREGTLVFLAPVQGSVTGAIFVGDGHFNLKAVIGLDAHELSRRTGESEVNEDFTEVVFRFSRTGRLSFLKGLRDRADSSGEASNVLEHWRDKVRHRHDEPTGFLEAILHGETMDNVDADILADIYNPSHPAFFNAYIKGKKHKDLRFFVRTRCGALPQLDSSEEVALINYDPDGMAMDDGVWYLAHLQSEYDKHTASSEEDRRLFATRKYKIETVIAKNGHLFSTATITFAPLVQGERVLKFGLLPNLRVSRVADESGQDLYFVQESRKEDGSFYAILPQSPALDKEESITVEYAGDKVLEEAGAGSYYVRARDSWYPNLNGFGEKALYDLTFKVPKQYKIISVGKLQGEVTDKDLATSHWVTPLPVAVAGFNYGEYQRFDITDDNTGYKISGYYLNQLPDVLRSRSALQSMQPKHMTEYALQQTRAQLQLCSHYFGKIPYGEVFITEQPNFNFGQSWPNLIYLPISAYTDSTQRWMLFGQISRRFTGFVQEVTPHEVAHQWWGHAVGWSSYHDQWLSEGFAEFSAGLFLQNAVGGDWRKDYIDFWNRLRERILEKNEFGVSPNDAGPIWMGLRLNAPRTKNAYVNVTYPKGAYILQMLRSMMYSAEDKDQQFIAMMHEFVETHRDKAASTESFKAVAEKYITKDMNLRGNGRLDWFFDEWVYGTQVPKYRFEYQITPADGQKVRLHMTLTQSEVDQNFAMVVPIFADFGKGMMRLGQAGIGGNTTRDMDVILPMRPKKVAINAYKEILER